ncbi:hypothetical protein B0O99DRAFT_589954 [Bisporella sp. PMI_857]|nr:hypothetical protein B0O99DRAFT_590930 [Bisporella sp. PMI_857]KAH8600273.1 hypothetical protein B0O99DRAFT_589954 [Bisporella sp. PMI_857]
MAHALKAVRRANEQELKGISDDGKRVIKLAELNVRQGVEVLLSNYVVEEAIRDRGLSVHGVVYDIGVGRLRDLGCGTKGGKGVDTGEGEVVKGNHGVSFQGQWCEHDRAIVVMVRNVCCTGYIWNRIPK